MIPLATTTITIKRRQNDPLADLADPADEGGDPVPEFRIVEEEVPAVLSPPTANNNMTAGNRQTYSSRLICEPADVQADDVVVDAMDGSEWMVLWARPVQALGLDHMEGQLRQVRGVAP